MATSIAELEATITADTSDFDGKMAAAGQSVTDLGGKARASGADWGGASAAMATGAAGIAAGFAGAISTAMDFESALSGIASVGGADAVAAMDDIRATAMELGATTSFSASEAAAGMEELIKAGVPVQDVLNGAAQSALDLSAATGVATDAAAGYIAQGLNVFNDTLAQSYGTVGERAEHVANVLAQAANASATDVGELGYAMSEAGTVAAMFGLSIDDTATALAVLAQNGISGSSAGTGLKTMFLSLTNASKPTKEALADIGLTLDDFYDSTGNFIGIESSFDMLRAGMEDMGYTSQQVNATLGQIFGPDAVRAAGIFYDTHADGWDSMRAGMANAGTVQEQAAIRLDNLQGSMDALSGTIETVAIVFGSALIPAIRPAVDALNGLVGMFLNLPEPVQTTIAMITAGVGAFLGVGSAIGFVLGPLGAFIAALAPVAAGIVAIAAPLALVVAGIAALYLAYQTNFLGFADGVNAAAALVQEGLGNLAQLAQDVAAAFGEGGLSAALGVLSEAFGTAWSNISEAISGIDWGAVSTAVQTGLQSASDAILTWIGEQSANLQAAFNAVDWSALGGTILNGITAALSLVGDLSQALLSKGAELLGGLLQGITDKWPEVTAWLGTVAALAGEALGPLAETLITKGGELLGGLFQGIQDKWPEVSAWLGTVGALAVEAAGDLLSTLLQKGADLIAGLKAGIDQHWPEVSSWLGTVGSLAVTAIGELVGTLLQKGVDLITGIKSGIDQQWPEVSTWLGTVATLATTAIGDLLSTLLQKGIDLIAGLLQGLTDKWPDVTSWLAGLPGAIVAAIGDLSAVLYQAGVDLIGGLVSGILSQAGAIADAIGQVVPDVDINLGGINISNPLTNPFDQGGGGSSSGGSSASGGRRVVGGGSSARARGGPVTAGEVYTVGEEGMELYVPERNGRIIPNDELMEGFGRPSTAFQPSTYINQVILRDERDMEHYVRRAQRAQRVMAGRG